MRRRCTTTSLGYCNLHRSLGFYHFLIGNIPSISRKHWSDFDTRRSSRCDAGWARMDSVCNLKKSNHQAKKTHTTVKPTGSSLSDHQFIPVNARCRSNNMLKQCIISSAIDHPMAIGSFYLLKAMGDTFQRIVSTLHTISDEPTTRTCLSNAST